MDSNGGDVYYLPSVSDNLESSRDLIAFYAKDGGASTNGEMILFILEWIH